MMMNFSLQTDLLFFRRPTEQKFFFGKKSQMFVLFSKSFQFYFFHQKKIILFIFSDLNEEKITLHLVYEGWDMFWFVDSIWFDSILLVLGSTSTVSGLKVNQQKNQQNRERKTGEICRGAHWTLSLTEYK